MSAIKGRNNYIGNPTKSVKSININDIPKKVMEKVENKYDSEDSESDSSCESENTMVENKNAKNNDKLLTVFLDLIHKKKEFDKSFQALFEYMKDI